MITGSKSPAEWMKEFAINCEIEKEDLHARVWRSGKPELEWDDPRSSLEAWKNDKDLLGLVASYPDAFSFLCELLRRCQAIDQLLTIKKEKDRLHDFLMIMQSNEEKYGFQYFRLEHVKWMSYFTEWYDWHFKLDPRSFTSVARAETEKVAWKTGNFVLIEVLHDAIHSFPDLWQAWGSDGLAVKDGITGRLDALLYLYKKYELRDYRIETTDDYLSIEWRSIEMLRRVLREEQSSRTQENGGPRLRRKRQPKKATENSKIEVHTSSGKTIPRGWNEFLAMTSHLLPTPRPRMMPHTFTITVVSVFVASSILFLLSLLHNDQLYSAISQTTLSAFQAICALRHSDRFQPEKKARLSDHFRFCMCLAAVCSFISAATYPFSQLCSYVSSYLSNIGQATAIIFVTDTLVKERDVELEQRRQG